MYKSVNCTSFSHTGDCWHQAAPRRLFGPAKCIVWRWHTKPHSDPREMSPTCALCTPRENPIMMPGMVRADAIQNAA